MKEAGMMSVTAYAVKTAKGTLERYDYETGPLGTDDVEIQVTHCGICYSDISMIDNSWGVSQYPLVPGHEAVGVITAVGASVGRIRQVGQRVGVGWYAGSCDACEWCLRGKENLCPDARRTIIGQYGGWANSVRCQAKFAMPIPNTLSSENAGPLMCAGATVFTPIAEFGVQPWMRTAVAGIGGLGHLAVQFLAKFGCEVTAISSSPGKDEDARSLGADHVIVTTGSDELARAAGSFDFIMSTVGASLPWGDYVGALRPQGRLVLVGIPESDICIPVFPLLLERSVSGGGVGGPSDTARMLEFAARAGIVPRIEQFPMAEVNSAVDRVRS
ncbi:MAG: NAD(P)-dependent alcohol dehydrogenase, partial [Pseudonocardiaceae bacterium]